MKNRISKLVVGSLMGSLVFGVANMDADTLKLSPAGVCAELNNRLLSGEINERTLIVFDVDDTLIKGGSDQNPNGPIPISRDLPEVIKNAQARGAVVIALTCVTEWFDNQFAVVDGKLAVISATPKFIITPEKLIQAEAEAARLRIEGLKCVGIDLNNYEFQNFPRVFPCISEDHRGHHLAAEDVLKEKNFVCSFSDQERNVWDYFSVLSGGSTAHVHFIRNRKTNSLMEVFCAPVFSEGVLFTNHFSKEGSGNDAKGECLITFVDLYKRIHNRDFDNVIFVDDKYKNVQDVEAAVQWGLGKECLAIQILSLSKR